MPTLSVGNDIVFRYADSGPIENVEYSTIVLVHGYTFHTGGFKKTIALASSHLLRVICLSRREYEGSTPYSTDEMKTIYEGSDTERVDFWRNEGVLLALFVDKLIQTLALPKKGGVLVAGWSSGNIWTVAMRASIGFLPDNTRQRLKEYTRGFIILEPPCQALGISADGYIPLWDHSIPEEARGPAFTKWVSSYYKHGDLSSRDFSQLNQREADESRKPTTDTIPIQELLTIIDVAPAVKWENFIADSPHFSPIFMKHTTKALFDLQIREDWGGHPVWFVYGDASCWNVHYAAWELEKKVKNSEINFKLVKGTNHFIIWDAAEQFLSIIKECLLV